MGEQLGYFGSIKDRLKERYTDVNYVEENIRRTRSVLSRISTTTLMFYQFQLSGSKIKDAHGVIRTPFPVRNGSKTQSRGTLLLSVVSPI